MNKSTARNLVGSLALAFAAAMPASAQPNTADSRDEAIAKWKALRIGLFILWGVDWP